MITFKKFQRYSVIGIKNMNNGFRMTWIINFFLHNKDEAISYNFVHGEEPCLELDGPTFLSRLSCHISSCFLQSELINSKRKQSSRNNYRDIKKITILQLTDLYDYEWWILSTNIEPSFFVNHLQSHKSINCEIEYKYYYIRSIVVLVLHIHGH